MADELTALRETVSRLNRRCQAAEAAARGRVEPGERTIGRALANWAAADFRRRLEESESENARLRAKCRRLGLRLAVRYLVNTWQWIVDHSGDEAKGREYWRRLANADRRLRELAR